MASAVLVSNDDDDTQSLLKKDRRKSYSYKNNAKKPRKARSKRKPKRTFIRWVCDKPWTKLPLLYFLIGLWNVPVLAVLHFMDSDTAFIISGAYILLNIFGFKHFYTLIGLKEKVDQFDSLNKKFNTEHNKVSDEVDKLEMAHDTLKDSADRIKRANAKNRENLNQFSQLQTTMEQMNIENIEELTKVQNRANKLGNRWEQQVIERERDMLHTVFDRFELASGKAGMTEKEFDQFAALLPDAYQERFARLGTFSVLSHDGKVLNFSDFNAALDLFAEMSALDVDIEFSVQKSTMSGTDVTHKPNKYAGRDRKSTLVVEPLDELKEDEVEEFANMGMMKRWRTTRKSYNDNINRKIVVHRRTFRTPQARAFTSDIGLATRRSSVASTASNSKAFGIDDEDDGDFSDEQMNTAQWQDEARDTGQIDRDLAEFLKTGKLGNVDDIESDDDDLNVNGFDWK